MSPNGRPEPHRPSERELDDARQTSGLAIASLFLSIIWGFWFGSVAGIVLGIRAIREIDSSQGEIGGRSLAIAGIVIGLIGLSTITVFVLIVIQAAD
ncbi:DUF4190 domain-containing protein [Thermoleophilia bacterium SCSIO 60948]|nr:DUF4190 domain-containing protein [Thermoleophilia bacterium SCSIO 60948]